MPPASPPGAIGRVLIVDDEAIIRGMLEAQLRDRYTVFMAENAAAAFEVLKREQVDLVISDINMPGMKGYDLLNRVRELYPAIRTALITAYNTDDYVRMAKVHNISNIIPKSTPFNFDEFDALVHGLVTQNIFGLSRRLRPQGRIAGEYLIRGSADIVPTEQAVLAAISAFHRPEPFVQILLEELITNAVYHAPVDAEGRAKYQKHSPVSLQESESVSVTLGVDDEKYGVSVSDRSGRLTKEQVLFRLDRHINAEGVLDESGRGLHMSRLYADRLIINIKRGVATEVIFLIYTTEKYVGFKPLYINEL
jgi:CheY-like chemotaxis protein